MHILVLRKGETLMSTVVYFNYFFQMAGAMAAEGQSLEVISAFCKEAALNMGKIRLTFRKHIIMYS